MAPNTDPLMELTLTYTGTEFTNGDGTGAKAVVTGGTYGTRIDMLHICSNDTAAINLAFWMHIGQADHYLGNVVVPIGSGYLAVGRVDAILSLSPSLNYLVVPNGQTLMASCVAQMTINKTCTVMAMGGDF